MKQTIAYCIKCNDTNDDNFYPYNLTRCKKCIKECTMSSMSSENGKIKRKQRYQKNIQKERDNNKSRTAKYYKKIKDTVSDSYAKKCLRQNGNDINENSIKEKKKSILISRIKNVIKKLK